MGRTKTFDEQEVLQKAMLLFWKNGYQPTTYALLEQVTGLTGRSLINAFGDKDAIFERVLERYYECIRQQVETRFKSPGFDAIHAFFEDLACAKRSDPRNQGCLILNCIYELEKITPEARRVISDFRAMFLAVFESSLRIECVTNPKEKAELLVVCLWGIGSEIRLAGRVSAARTAIDQVMQLIRVWKKVA